MINMKPISTKFNFKPTLSKQFDLIEGRTWRTNKKEHKITLVHGEISMTELNWRAFFLQGMNIKTGIKHVK